MTNTYTPVTIESLGELDANWVVAPGEIIKEMLEERGWSQGDLANRLALSTKHVSLLLNGHERISQETALRLERVLGSKMQFWLNLESQYREILAQRESLELLKAEAAWLKEVPVNEMIRLGYVAKATDKARQVLLCLRFYGVASVAAWRTSCLTPVAAFRGSGTKGNDAASIAAWLRYGEMQALEASCAVFDAAKLRHAVVEARSLMTNANVQQLLARLRLLLSGCGVALVIAPPLKGCKLSGAAKRLKTDKALIMLSLRGKSDDRFWFTLFHEAAHLVLHSAKLTFIDQIGSGSTDEKEEAEADQFARDLMLPAKPYASFCEQGPFTETRLRAFAKSQGVPPSIVVGRLQWDQRIPFSRFNHLKFTCDFA